MPIPRSKIDEIRTANPLTTTLNEYGVELKPSGVRLTGLCPIHNERSPSFSVNPQNNTFKCFGCGEGGDVIALIQHLESLSFVGALEFLADKAGVIIDRTEEEDETFQKRQVIYKVLKDTAEWYDHRFRELADNHKAKEELQRRNLYSVKGDPQWLRRNGIGYAPDGWDKLCIYLKNRGYSDEAIVEAGLASRNADSGRITDRFRGRLTWEIRDVQGRVVGFGARRLFEADTGPKYLNSPQTLLYDKSRILYGLDYARKTMSQKRELYLVEGYTDVMTLRAIGIDNVVAMSGTAFGEGHISLLRRVFDDVTVKKGSAGKLIFVFDGDKAGQKAAMRVFEMEGLPHERSYGVALSEGDPDDIRRAEGNDYLAKVLSQYIPLTEYALKAEMATHDLSTAEGRINYVNKSLEIISIIDSVALREDYKRKIAFLAGVSLESLANIRVRSTVPQNNETNIFDGYDDYDEYGNSINIVEDPAMKQQKICLALLMQYPMQTMQVIDKLEVTSDIFTDVNVDAFNDVTMVARYLISNDEPVVLTPNDVDDESYGMELAHYPLNIKSSDETVADAIENSFKGLIRFASHKMQASLSSKLAQISDGIENGDADQLQAVEELLLARKEAALKRKQRKTR